MQANDGHETERGGCCPPVRASRMGGFIEGTSLDEFIAIDPETKIEMK